MKHFSISFKPDGRQISIHAGATLLEAAGQAGIILNTICGGQGTCEKCLVRLEPDGKQVLACQYHIQSDLTVTIPPESRFFEHKILVEGIETKELGWERVTVARQQVLYAVNLYQGKSGEPGSERAD